MSHRLSRQRFKDAQRQQQRRAAMASARRPATHAVDSALVEALAYTSVECRPAGVERRDVMLPFRQVLFIAIRILAHGGRYDWREASRAVVARVRERKATEWRLDAPRRPGEM
jgi:hypothetical protein